MTNLGIIRNSCRQNDGLLTSANVEHLAKELKTENPLLRRQGASPAPLHIY